MSLPARLRWRGTALIVAFVTMLAAFASAVPEARAFTSVSHGVPPRPPAPASRGVRDKVELMSLTNADTRTVQETFLCADFEYCTKNAGMRGWPFPL